MTKLQTVLASLVAVIPAGLLAAVIVLGMLNHFEAISGVMPLMAAAILGLLCCVAIMLTPVIVLMGGEKGPAGTKRSARDSDDDFEPADSDDELLATGDVDMDEDFEDDDEEFESGEFESADEMESFDDESEDFDDSEWEDDDEEL